MYSSSGKERGRAGSLKTPFLLAMMDFLCLFSFVSNIPPATHSFCECFSSVCAFLFIHAFVLCVYIEGKERQPEGEQSMGLFYLGMGHGNMAMEFWDFLGFLSGGNFILGI